MYHLTAKTQVAPCPCTCLSTCPDTHAFCHYLSGSAFKDTHVYTHVSTHVCAHVYTHAYAYVNARVYTLGVVPKELPKGDAGGRGSDARSDAAGWDSCIVDLAAARHSVTCESRPANSVSTDHGCQRVQVRMFIHTSVHMSIHMSMCISTHLSMPMYLHIPVHKFVHTVCLYTWPHTCLCPCLCPCLYTCL